MVKLPSSAIIAEANKVLDPYLLALGKVAHSWNHMHDQLGQLFCVLAGLDLSAGMILWHTLKSDRTQREILTSALKIAARDEDWGRKFPKAEAEIKWLMSQVQSLADRRNDAIHAPCHVSLEDGGFVVSPITFFQNPRAKKLDAKDILAEFTWYESSASTLNRYAGSIMTALDSQDGAWPDRPLLPTLGQDKNGTK